jgi:hypothetical protein
VQNLLNTFGPSGLVALVINTNPDDRKRAVEFAERMPYTFVQLQGDLKFNFDFAKSAGAAPSDTVLLDRSGRVVYEMYPGNNTAVQRTSRVIRAFEAHDGGKPVAGGAPGKVICLGRHILACSEYAKVW